VHSSVIFSYRLACVTLVAGCAILGAQAETIHLKNGRTIWADHVRDTGTRLEYDIGDDNYAISKTSVDHIDSGGVAPQGSGSSGDSKSVPTFVPATENVLQADNLTGKIIVNGAVNQDELSSLEASGNTKLTAASYYVAGKHEFERGNFVQSRGYFEKSLRYDPENAAILNYYAAVLVRSGDAANAIVYAQRAVRIAPNSPDALAVLGYAQFAGDRNRDAIETWKRSLALRPDAQIQALLAKAERESTAEANFSERESGHFTLRYEGKQNSDELAKQIINVLEDDYSDLVRQLGVAPRASIPVILYTEQAFFDVTQAPTWTGAINDGKLRIPVQGVTSVNTELAHVLKHELTHSFVNQLSGGRCPQWLNEGIAQFMEPRTLSGGRNLSALFHVQHEIPFNNLEGSFMRFSGTEANLAYAESLAAVEYIADTYGVSDLERILERMGQGSSSEAALRSTIHSGYDQFGDDVGKYLTGKYGS
jgi:tetratricopeptide (TPR) repeat protein